MEHSFNGSNELPPFGDWIDMLVDGVKYIVVNIVYLFIPAFITGFIAIIILLVMRAYGLTGNASTFLNAFIVTVLVVGIIIMIFPYILSLIALPHLVKKNKVEVAFDVKGILSIIKQIGWIKYISGVVLPTALSWLVSALNGIPQLLHMGQIVIYAVSAIIGLFIGSYLTAFRGRFLALLYQEGTEEKNDS